MIWQLAVVDQALIDAFEPAGEPDQRVIDAYIQRLHRPQHQTKHDGFKRWYYLCRDNPRVRLATVGRPLDDWGSGAAKILVGINEIIGEFIGNRDYIGMRGLQLQFQPIGWLHGDTNLEIADGTALLAEISEQILDRQEIEKSQRQIQRRYEWKK